MCRRPLASSPRRAPRVAVPARCAIGSPACGRRGTAWPRQSSGSRRAARRSPRFASPWPASSATRSSVGVSASLACRRPPRRRASASTLASHSGLRRDAKSARAWSSVPAASRRRPRRLQDGSLHEQRAASLERPVEALVLLERAFGRLERVVVRAASGCNERRRPGACREPPRAVEAATVLLELGHQLERVVGLAERDEHLDRVRVNRVRRPLTEAGLAEHRRHLHERVPRRGKVADRELEVTERPEMVGQPDRRLDLSRVLDAVGQHSSGVLRHDPGALRRSRSGTTRR